MVIHGSCASHPLLKNAHYIIFSMKYSKVFNVSAFTFVTPTKLIYLKQGCSYSIQIHCANTTSLYTVGLNMCVTLKKCPHKPNIFLIPLNISELTTSQNFFVTVWSPGGVIIAFAENWNFELKFFLVNSFRKKMTSR